MGNACLLHRLLFGPTYASYSCYCRCQKVQVGSPERCSSDHLVLCWWCSHTSLTWYNRVDMTTAVAKASLLIQCQIYARCCGQNTHRPWHSSATALRLLLSSPQRVSPCPTHAHKALGAPRVPCLPREALGFPILTLPPETGDPGQLAAKLPFLGKDFCYGVHIGRTLLSKSRSLIIPCCVCSLISK